MKWVYGNFLYWVIQIGVSWVEEVMECKFQKSEIFADAADQSFKNVEL